MTETNDLHYPRWTEADAATARELAAGWQDASEKAFGVATTEPALYQRTATVVGALHRRLHDEGPGPVALVRAWESRVALLDEIAAIDPGRALAGLQVDTVAGAAFAMRYREVLAEIAADRRLGRLSTADPEVPWLVLEESGYSAGDPFVAYHRLEVEQANGRALLVSTRPDDTFSSVVHEVLDGSVDLVTGELGWSDDTVARDFPDEASREAYVDNARSRASG
ncbi:MAG: hypothetical protein ABI873_10980 [Marmoricola sp.]